MSPETPKKPHNPVRTREEVEVMNADFDREQNRKRIAERLGDSASKDVKPEK